MRPLGVVAQATGVLLVLANLGDPRPGVLFLAAFLLAAGSAMHWPGEPPDASADLRDVYRDPGVPPELAAEADRLERARLGVNLRTIASWDPETKRRVASAIRGDASVGSSTAQDAGDGDAGRPTATGRRGLPPGSPAPASDFAGPSG